MEEHNNIDSKKIGFHIGGSRGGGFGIGGGRGGSRGRGGGIGGRLPLYGAAGAATASSMSHHHHNGSASASPTTSAKFGLTLPSLLLGWNLFHQLLVGWFF